MLLRTIMAGAIAASILIGSGASASAATTIGQAPPAIGTPESCAGSPLVQLGVSSGADYVVPSAGVITKWTTSLSGTAELSVFRPAAGAGNYSRIAADSHGVEGTLTSFDARIPVLANDRIGLQGTPSATNCQFNTGVNADVVGVGTTAPVGGPPATYSPTPTYRLNLAAVVEPDADGDDYGDETQDGCPTDAAVHGPCPDVTAPQTTITKAPTVVKLKKGKKRARVRIRFASDEAGGTFACSLDGKPAKPCTSPFKAKVKKGKHRFTVVATDAAGNTDGTAATAKFRVKRKS